MLTSCLLNASFAHTDVADDDYDDDNDQSAQHRYCECRLQVIVAVRERVENFAAKNW